MKPVALRNEAGRPAQAAPADYLPMPPETLAQHSCIAITVCYSYFIQL